MKPAEVLWIALLADYLTKPRRRSRGPKSLMRLTIPPVSLPAVVWEKVAAHILDLRPRCKAVELVDVANRLVARAAR